MLPPDPVRSPGPVLVPYLPDRTTGEQARVASLRYPRVFTREIQMTSFEDQSRRRCARVISMVHELHKRGYQRLRIAPGWSGSGMHWRCYVTFKPNITTINGGRLGEYEEKYYAFYGSGQNNEYFGWRDRKEANARQLADTFLERFPKIAITGKGEDFEYAGWFTRLLGHAEAGHFPICFGDDSELDAFTLVSVGTDEPAPKFTKPPPGEFVLPLD
jgi:hypothetical protein